MSNKVDPMSKARVIARISVCYEIGVISRALATRAVVPILKPNPQKRKLKTIVASASLRRWTRQLSDDCNTTNPTNGVAKFARMMEGQWFG